MDNPVINESLPNTEHQQLLGEPLPNDHKSKFVYVVTVFAAIGGFLFGYDTGVVSGATLLLKKEFHLSPFQQELFISIALIGAIVGSFVGGPLSDKFGRKPIICVASVLFAAGSIVLGVAHNIDLLFVGRFVVGAGIGVAANIVPVYVAEISPPEMRGTLVTVNNLCITSGQFISYLVDSAFVHVHDGWRYMLGIAAIPAIIQLVAIVMVGPESPRWLVSNGKEEKSLEVLKKVRSSSWNVSAEMEEIKQSLREESGGWRELFSSGIRPALVIGMALQAFQQFCGINTAMYYSATIIQMAGYENPATAIWFSNTVAFANALLTVLALYLIDRVGRRKLLMCSISGLVVGLVLLGMSFYFQEHNILSDYTGAMAVGSLVLYVAFFAIGMGPVPWAVNAEIYPLSVRGLANGVATTINWSANLLVSMTFLTYIDVVTRTGAFMTYAGAGVVSLVFFYLMLPETKGKSIEEITTIFKGGFKLYGLKYK